MPSTSDAPLPPGSQQHGNLPDEESHQLASAQARQSFEARRVTIATEFLAELDRTMTNGQVAAMTRPTGGVKIVWSQTLKSRAGQAKCQRETIQTDGKATDPATIIPTRAFKVTIDLAARIIDNEDKLLNTLAHEFCHVANMLVSNVWEKPHGVSFKKWGAKVGSRFAHKNIHVTRTHSYAIDYKYIWACTKCTVRYKRHSKRIKPDRQVCGRCRSKLVQIKPAPDSSLSLQDKEGTKTDS